MTYNPNIPIVTDILTGDCTGMQTNFSQANTLIANDHYAFDDATSANRGYHKQIYFPNASGSVPSLGSFAGVLFTQNDPNDTAAKPQLYWKNSSNTYQVSNRFRSSGSSGYWMLDNGSGTTGSSAIMMWGSASIPTSPTSGTVAVTFPTISNYTGGPVGFPNNLYNVQFSVKCSSSASQPNICIDTSSFSTTGFQFRYSSGGTAATVYWQAIGN